MFFATNTGASISLKNCQFKYGSKIFLNAKAIDTYGQKGANGGDVSILLTNQNIEGDFNADELSSFHLILKNSNIKGTINGANTAKTVTITLDLDSTIEITGNSYSALITNEKLDGSNLINGTYKWTIGNPVNPTGSAQSIFSSKFAIIGISLILSMLLL